MIGRAASLAAVAALAGGLAACGGSSSGGSSSGGGSCSAGSAAVSQAGSPAATVAATDNLAFTPATTSVGVGLVLQWKNTGQIMHTITFESGNASCLTDVSFNGGGTWDVTFKQTGTYAYHCTIHPQMTGVITVHT